MPIYEYRCESCGRQHEALQKLNDKPLKACPSCGKRALRRLMSAPRFRLKGAGWYETDFKSDKDKKRNLADSGGEAAPASAAASDSSGASAGDKSGEKSGHKQVEKSASGDKSAGPTDTKAGGKGRAKPSAVRKPGLARRRSRTRRA